MEVALEKRAALPALTPATAQPASLQAPTPPLPAATPMSAQSSPASLSVLLCLSSERLQLAGEQPALAQPALAKLALAPALPAPQPAPRPALQLHSLPL